MPPINEKSTGFLECKFKDEKGYLVTPELIKYTIYDRNSNTPIQAEVTVVPTSFLYVIEIPSSVNTIIDDQKKYEVKYVVLTYTFSGGKQKTEQFSYEVMNLSKL